MFQELFQVFIQFIYAPVIFPKMLWILIPLLLSVLLTELYFKKYSRVGIGHHKSLENTIFLVFICFNLFSYVISMPNTIRFYLVAYYTLFCLGIGVLDYLHKLSTDIRYKISTKFVIAYISYVTITLVYSNLLENLTIVKVVSIVVSIVFLFLIFVFVKKMISYLEPKSYEQIDGFLKHVEDAIKEAHGKDK